MNYATLAHEYHGISNSPAGYGTSNKTEARKIIQDINNSSTYLAISAAGVPPATMPDGSQIYALLTADFSDATKLIGALRDKQWRYNHPNTKVPAVMYDSENWKATPADQQQDPATWYNKAAQVAHNYGYQFIAAPAMNLVNTIATVRAPYASMLPKNIPGCGAASNSAQSPQGCLCSHARRPNCLNTGDAFIAFGIPAAVAGNPHVHVFSIQDQRSESKPAYQSIAADARRQAQRANPKVIVFDGLSTNFAGTKATVQQILTGADSLLPRSGTSGPSVPLAKGFWLNDSVHGTACRDCDGPWPGVLATALAKFPARPSAP